MRTTIAVCCFLFAFSLLVFSPVAFAQISVGVSVNFGPPPIPVYEQPICPTDGYLWTPGYWAYDEGDGYYWVPGTWFEPPQVGFLWTPGYWGWGGNAFLFHEGYWGSQVGFYGGVNYGFGYGGDGYQGGRWEGGRFSYNTYVNHLNTTVIHNTYNTRVTVVSESRVSFNGGSGGVTARPTAREESYANEHHVGPVAAQAQHAQEARSNPELRASANHGKPPVAATAKPGDFKTGVVASKEAGGEYKAPPADARGNESRPAAENRAETNMEARSNANKEASELQPHKSTPPNTGNAGTDKKYQHQQDQLAARQTQDHQKLQQQQAKEHQQATKKNYNDTQKAQMEQRHSQQTQQVEQKHATQQAQMQQRQAQRPTASKAESRPSAEKPR